MDRWIGALDSAMRTLFGKPVSASAPPQREVPPSALSATESEHSACLMRVTHAG